MTTRLDVGLIVLMFALVLQYPPSNRLETFEVLAVGMVAGAALQDRYGRER